VNGVSGGMSEYIVNGASGGVPDTPFRKRGEPSSAPPRGVAA